MILSDIEAALRLDLFDPAGTNERWSQADLDRAIDKAVDRYAQYYPNLVYTDITTQPYQRTYPYPTSWDSAYPVWWLERILYPLQAYGSTFNAPSVGANAIATTGTALGVGVYQYAVTLLTQGGESTPSPLSSVTTTTGNQAMHLSTIPLGNNQTAIPGTATNVVIGRNVYRTQVGGSNTLPAGNAARQYDNELQRYHGGCGSAEQAPGPDSKYVRCDALAAIRARICRILKPV